MDRIKCSDCGHTFCSRYNMIRHTRKQHSNKVDIQVSQRDTPIGTSKISRVGESMGQVDAHLSAPDAHSETHSGAHSGAHLGAHSGAHLGAHSGAHSGAHLGAHSNVLGAHLESSGVHLKTAGAHISAEGPFDGERHDKQHDLSQVLQNYKNTTENDYTVLQHPFTMLVSGPTACGKTTFVEELLKHHKFRITPGLQRIVWLYKRWQPLYDEIQGFVWPKVEFIRGIPADLDDDDFFDTRVNNLLVIDDLFSETDKDKRITDLFTEGSHHRSLSVISINQNLFGNRNPTQRRNCHYLVLFNNPIDRQSLMTVARQMYPGHTKIFMKSFAKAIKYPYGYLLVDLKPFTTENDRLKHDLKWNSTQNQKDDALTNQTLNPHKKSIKDAYPSIQNHLKTGDQTVHTVDNNGEDMAEKGQACDDCGLLFDSSHDVRRHVKRGWCPEHTGQQKRKFDEVMEYGSDENESTEENDAFIHLWKRAKESNEEKLNQIYGRFIEDGENSDEAQEMADERVQPYNEKVFFCKYKSLLENYIIPLKNNGLHNKIMKEIDTLILKNMNTVSAVAKAVRKHRHAFQDVFDTDISDDETEDNEEDSVTEPESE